MSCVGDITTDIRTGYRISSASEVRIVRCISRVGCFSMSHCSNRSSADYNIGCVTGFDIYRNDIGCVLDCYLSCHVIPLVVGDAVAYDQKQQEDLFIVCWLRTYCRKTYFNSSGITYWICCVNVQSRITC